MDNQKLLVCKHATAISGSDRPLPSIHMRALVHLFFVSNLSARRPKKMPEVKPKTVKINVLTNEYSALNRGKFLPKKIGRK